VSVSTSRVASLDAFPWGHWWGHAANNTDISGVHDSHSLVQSSAPRSELASEVRTSPFAQVSSALVSSHELHRALAPSHGFTAKPLVLVVVEFELISAKSIEPREHV